MFIGCYTLDKQQQNYLYYNCREGWEQWHTDTFSPETKDIDLLVLKVSGKTYQERKGNALQLAIDWQTRFARLSWSYSELAEITSYFEKIGKRYGLLKEFKENAIC
jgi:hypothetical protein